MHLTKRQSLVGAGIVLAAVLFLFIIALNRGAKIPSRRTSAPPPPDTIVPSATQAAPGQIVLDSFHRVETRNGKPVWEVKASKGVLDPRTNEAVLEDARVTLSRDRNEPLSIAADRAKVLIMGSALQNAEAWGNVLIRQKDMELRSQEAHYNMESGEIHVPGAVELKNSFLMIEGKELTGNADSQVFHLHEDVETTIEDGKQVPQANENASDG